MHANSTVGSLQFSAPEPEPEPCDWQSTAHVAAVSVPLHMPSPQKIVVLEPEPLLPRFEPCPQSAGQLFTSFAAQMPSPQWLPLVEASGDVWPVSDEPPKLHATTNDNAHAAAERIPEECLIMRGIVRNQD